MILLTRLKLECLLLRRSPGVLLAFILLFLFSAWSVVVGITRINNEKNDIASLIERDRAEQEYALTYADDYGDAAYDTFYGVWNPPSALAFAAYGQRDMAPFMMRIRALAIEGQIYETDSANAELVMTGSFDYAFLAAYILPLFVIFILYDLRTSEIAAGRNTLLELSAGTAKRVWLQRILLRVIATMLAVSIPFWTGMAVEGVDFAPALAATMIVFLQIMLWTVVTLLAGMGSAMSSATIAVTLTGIWLTVSLLIPITGKTIIEEAASGVRGAEVSLLQREAVNDAWDLPKSATMEPFYASHPEWADSEPVTTPFHWKWYYAFQQRGDEIAAGLAAQYRQGIILRDQLSGMIAWLSPAIAVQRRLQALAGTDIQASLEFEDQVRDYHEQIRKSYYPYLFQEVPFDREVLREFQVPEYAPASYRQ